MGPQGRIRWYNPKDEDFQWREVPPTDERALQALGGSPLSPICTRTYREWRELGASIGAAFIRAGEAAKAEHDAERQEEGEEGLS